MYDLALFIKDQLTNNQWLIGILGGVLLTGLGIILKVLPVKIYDRVYHTLVSTLDINTGNCKDYYSISKYASLFILDKYNRFYTINLDSKLEQGYGKSFGLYKGVLFTCYRSRDKSALYFDEHIKFTFLTRNKNLIKDFLKEAMDYIDKDSVRVFSFDSGSLNTYVSRPKRSLNSVFIDNYTKTNTINLIEKFINSEIEYKTRGLNYKHCVLMHGSPGTGKTSFILALASYFSADLYLLSDINSIDSLNQVIKGKDQIKFVIIEDIDTISQKPLTRQSKKETDKAANIHNILQMLDGLNTPWGLVVFITTNYLESLDSAIIRPGRVDNLILIDKIEKEEIKEMFKCFYPDENVSIIEDYLSSSFYKPQLGSFLQSLFLENLAKEAVEKLINNSCNT